MTLLSMGRSRRWVFGGAVVATVCVGAFRVHAQDAAQTNRLTVNARLVMLDVVVTDKKGNPITDLKREDLHIYEDGKPRATKVFESPAMHTLPEAVAAETPEQAAAEVFDPAKPANFGQSPTTILVLDQLNTQFADSSFARRQLQEYLAKQPAVLNAPTTLVTIFPDHFKVLEGFTRDRAKLQNTLQKAPVKYPWQLALTGKSDYGPIQRLDSSLHALEEIAQAYASIKGRKNLIWIGGGFPALDPATLANKEEMEVRDTMKHVSNMLLDSRVVLYAVDPTSNAASMTELTNEQEMAFGQLTGELPIGMTDPVDEGADFDSLGTLTGGKVIRNMNNVATQIGIAVDYSSQYYTLGYTPADSQSEGFVFRNIRVVSTRPDVVVTTRNGYYAGQPAKQNALQNIAYDLSTAAESGTQLNGLHVNVELNGSVAVANDAWIVHVAAPELSWAPQADGTSKAEVAVMAVSLNKQGKMIGHVLRHGTADARAGVNLSDPTKIANFDFTAKPFPKATKLRFVVRDGATGRMGSFDVALK